MPVLQYDRLTLRAPSIEDWDAYALMLADPEVMRYLANDGKPLPPHAAWRAFAEHLGHWQLRGFGMFSVIERASGDFVGRVGPWQPEGWPDFEIGWTLRSDFWHRGYATEAARACLADAFTRLNRVRIISLITPENLRSIRVAERLGEQLDGEVTLPHLPPDKKVLQYSLRRDDWAASNADGVSRSDKTPASRLVAESSSETHRAGASEAVRTKRSDASLDNRW
jgi:RimJ/RimL family protein N-acetyltransferase